MTRRHLVLLIPVFLPLLLSLGMAQCEPGCPDSLMELDDGTPLQPIAPPWSVCVGDPDLLPAVGIAMAQWQSWAHMDEVPRDWFLPAEVPCGPEEIGGVYIDVGVPEGGGYAEADVATNVLGDIVFCDITVAFDWMWVEQEWLVLWLTHELGHCMGLGHASTGIMQSPTPPGTALDPCAFELLVGP